MKQSKALEISKELPIMEDFYSIQGEGFHTGLASYFIRIGGCDVGCHWCDVKESWDPKIHPLESTEKVVQRAIQFSKNIIVTGGEPLTWNMDFLTQSLLNANCKIHLETSGAYHLTGTWHWICLSPKKRSLPKKEIYQKANELKVIVHNLDDFRFAESQAELVNESCELYLQPEWSKREEMTPKIVDYVMKKPKWKISLQTHKYLHIP